MHQAPLSITTIGDPILRKPAKALTADEILSPEIQQLVAEMRKALGSRGVGLAAPQVGAPYQLLVAQDSEEIMSRLYTPEQVAERERRPIPFHAIFNPTLHLIEEAGTRTYFEGCLSVPDMVAVVTRAHTVMVEGLDLQGLPIRLQATGWYARVLQHEVDHLNGTLYIDRMIPETFMTRQHFETRWKDLPIAEVLQAFGVSMSPPKLP